MSNGIRWGEIAKGCNVTLMNVKSMLPPTHAPVVFGPHFPSQMEVNVSIDTCWHPRIVERFERSRTDRSTRWRLLRTIWLSSEDVVRPSWDGGAYSMKSVAWMPGVNDYMGHVYVWVNRDVTEIMELFKRLIKVKRDEIVSMVMEDVKSAVNRAAKYGMNRDDMVKLVEVEMVKTVHES